MVDERIWLIKSVHRVLGPYSFQDIIDQLQNKNITLIDEIKEPIGPWKFIREIPELSAAIKNIRDMQISESEETQATVLTRTMSDISTPIPDEKAEPLRVELRKSASGVASSTSNFNTQNYGQNQMRRRLEEKRPFPLLPVVGAIVALAVVILIGLNFEQIQKRLGSFAPSVKSEKPQTVGQGTVSSAADADRLFDKGIYAKALEVYERLTSLSNESKYKYATALLFVRNKTLDARHMFEDLNSQDFVPISGLNINSMIARTYVMEGEFDLALDKINLLPPSVERDFNKAVVTLLQEKYESAFEQFEKIKNHVDLDEYKKSIALGEALASFFIKGDKKSILENLNKFESSSDFLSSEFLFLKASLEFKSKDDKYKQTIEKMILHPLIDNKNFLEFFGPLDLSFTDWKYFSKICDAMASANSSDVRTAALGSYCLYRKSEVTAALLAAETARKQKNSDPLLLTWHSFILGSLGRNQELRINLKNLEDQGKQNTLSLYLNAKACGVDQNYDCTEKNLNLLKSINPKSEVVMDLLAENQLQMKNPTEARATVGAYMELFKDKQVNAYIPLLEKANALYDY